MSPFNKRLVSYVIFSINATWTSLLRRLFRSMTASELYRLCGSHVLNVPQPSDNGIV